MSTSEPRPGEKVKQVRFSDDELIVDLLDGRKISVPLAWYPRLLNATPEQRENWELAGGGFGIHWPDIDEDLSTEGLLRGAPAPRGSETVGGKGEGAAANILPQNSEAAITIRGPLKVIDGDLYMFIMYSQSACNICWRLWLSLQGIQSSLP